MVSQQAKRVSFLLFLLVLAFWFFRSTRKTGDKANGETATSSPASGRGSREYSSSDRPTAGQPVPEEKLPLPPCWDGLLQLDENPQLGSLSEALRLAADDPLLIEYLEQRLSMLIGSDANTALEVLRHATEAGPPLSAHLLSALKQSQAVHKPEIADKLVGLSLDEKAPLETRKSALIALETQHTLSASARSRLHGLAMDENSDEAAWLATRAIGKVMTEEFQRAKNVAPYLSDLLDIGQHSGESAVRALALEMPSYGNIPIDRSALAALSRVLSRDPDRSVREMAAMRMSLSADPKQALALLAAAFETETDLCVKWAIFRFAVRAAGSSSLPTLQKMAVLEPRLKPDYDDFVAIYARGVVDFERVWQEKPQRMQCLDEEG